MKILCVGDVCGSVGCNCLQRHLPELKHKYGADMVVVNGENSADGNGITPQSAQHLFSCGADVITGGNHTLRRREIFPVLEENRCLIRPDNLPECDIGSGYCLCDLGPVQVAVLNLSGTVYLERLGAKNPFLAVDELLERAKQDNANIILLDFHAEATSEKLAMGYYLAGKVSAVFGTHTHVQTADAQILPGGTAYITDLGMTGPADSVLGVKKEIIIARLRENNMQKFELAQGECMINACLFEIDRKSGLATDIQRIYLLEDGSHRLKEL